MLTYWLLFIILFGAVVFIHELGHFTVAKLSGVFVERFALGFGPALLKKKWGETEYAICALPLGGYVKMRGEDIEEEKGESSNPADPRSFALQSPWIRIAIAMMGPTANLILPVILFTSLFLVGMPTVTSQIGWVAPGSAAEKAGLRPGDRVTAINGSPVWKWTDVEETLRKNPNQQVMLTIDRSGQTIQQTVTPNEELDNDVFGKVVPVGKIGVMPNSFKAVIGISNPKSLAAQHGLQTGDAVVALNGKPIQYWWQFVDELKTPSPTKTFKVERFIGSALENKTETKEITIPTSVTSIEKLGVEDGELYIREVKPGSVAAEKGLLANDKLLAINNTSLESWTAFQQKIKANAGEKIQLTLLRNGKKVTVDFVPQEITDKNSVTQEKEKRRQLGVISSAVPGNVELKDERYRNPFRALSHGFSTTVDMTSLTIQGLVKLFTGKIALKKSLGGPISIFYLAGGSYETGGWTAFLRMMALLSITLGVINLLPIPVLDGGHIFFFLIEAIKGGPVSLRVREFAQQAGLVLILGLMLLTFYVDIERYFFDRIKALFN